MKRTIILICLFVVILIGFRLIAKGFESGNLEIASYFTIEKKSEKLTRKLASYNKKNQEEYDKSVENLNTSIKKYEESKSKYDAIYAELADVLNKGNSNEQDAVEEVIYSDKEKYKVDFLLVTLGAYGEKNGVDVIYQLATSSTIDANAGTLKYFLADLKFTITGSYINVSNFISDIENDDKLGWEIKNFSMSNGTNNGYTGVSATFTIKDVPIDSDSYLASTAGYDVTPQKNTQNNTQNSSGNVDNTTTNTVQNTTAFNTVSNDVSNNTTNTISNTVTNTVSNAVVNNAVN